MRPRLHVRCLGEPLLLDQLRRPIRLRVRKHIALIFFLVLEPRHKATRERLRRLLWPDGNSAQSLSQAIVEIRRGLGPDIFDVTDHHLALRPDADITTDLQMLQTGAGELMVRELSQSFWSHVLFDGYEFEDADEWNDWLGLERERWRERLGRLAEAVCANADWTPQSQERERLHLWAAHLLGKPIAALKSVASRKLRWDDLDIRVFDCEALLPASAPLVVLTVCGPIVADAMAVALSALRRREGRLAVAQLKDASPYIALAHALLALPGSMAASPSAVAVVQAITQGTPDSAINREALSEVLTAVREENAVVMITDAPSPALENTLRAITPKSGVLHNVWLVGTADAATTPSSGAAILTVQPAPMDQLLSAASRLANINVPEDGIQAAISRAHGSLALLAALLLEAPATTKGGVTLEHPAHDASSRARTLTDCTALPVSYCNLLAAVPDRTRLPDQGWATRKSTRCPKSDQQEMLVDILPKALLLEDPSSLLARLEDAAHRGDESGPSVMAGLLCLRLNLGVANLEVVSEAIDARCQTIIESGNHLEPAEALAFSLMVSHSIIHSAVNTSSLSVIRSFPDISSQVTRYPYLVAKLISAQLSRNSTMESEALHQLSTEASRDPKHRNVIEWVHGFGSANRYLRQGRYAEATHASTRLLNASEAGLDEGAYRTALGIRLISEFRLGRYSEVGTISAAYGATQLTAKARVQSSHTLLAARAAIATGSLGRSRVIQDAIEEHFIGANNVRGRLLGADAMAATGRHRTAQHLAESAFSYVDSGPLLEQEGLWAKWAAKVLPALALEEKLHQIAEMARPIDARDQLLIHRAASTRGVGVQLLESKGFHKHSIGEPALV
jgi:hypothetical protein